MTAIFVVPKQIEVALYSPSLHHGGSGKQSEDFSQFESTKQNSPEAQRRGKYSTVQLGRLPLYGFIVGATIGKGRIRVIDASRANRSPGMRLV